MGREENFRKNNDEEGSVFVHSSSSSIALLQERFRQLQKVKEMREEKEVVRLLSLSHQYSKTTHSFFFNNNTNTTCVVFEPSITTTPNIPHQHDHYLMMMKKKKKKKVAPTKMLTLQLPQTSLSLSLTSSSSNDQPNNIPTLMDLWPVPTQSSSSTTTSTTSSESAISFVTKLNDHDRRHDHLLDYSDSNIDVDTSLHL